MMRTLIITLAIPVLFTFGCGDEEPSDDATNGWRATQLAIGQSQGDWADIAVDGALDVDLDCIDGGSYRVIGAYSGNEEYDLSLEFDGCATEDVVIDGTLSMHAEVEVTENSTRVAVSYEGELSWSGAANGSCGIEATALVAVQSDENSSEVDVEFHGEICGYDADAVVHAST
jgi:hypothetical protein